MIGNIIGNYKVVKKLGEGGMGAVYLARDTSLERDVAMKVISSHLTKNPALMARFRIEAIAQAKLNHSNIVTIHSFNQEKDIFYIVMEYVEGQTLKDTVKDFSQIPMAESLTVFAQILEGVAYAHSKGVIHRDIKPANIFVSTLSGRHVAKIGDFGIAKVDGIDGLTKIGTTMGSSYYSAPEQLMGQKTDNRADIYSLGITLYEMLTGAPPLKVEGMTEYQAIKYMIETLPQKPSSVNPSIPASIDSLVMKCIAKNPEKRFQNVTEIIETIKQILPTLPAASLSGPNARSSIKPPKTPGKKGFNLNQLTTPQLVGIASFLLVSLVVVVFLIFRTGPAPVNTINTGPGHQASNQMLQQNNSGENTRIVQPDPDTRSNSNTPTTTIAKANTTNKPDSGSITKNPDTLTEDPTPRSNSLAKSISTTDTPSKPADIEDISKRMNSLIKNGNTAAAIQLGHQQIHNGNATGEIFYRMAQAYYYAGQEEQARPYYFKTLNAGRDFAFHVTYLAKKDREIEGVLIVDLHKLAFRPSDGSSSDYGFSMTIPNVKSVSEDSMSDLFGLLKKKKNRRNPLLNIKDNSKNKYVVETNTDDKKMRSFIQDVILTLKRKAGGA